MKSFDTRSLGRALFFLCALTVIVSQVSCQCSRRPLPFPPVGPLAPDDQIDLIRTRYSTVRSLWAVVQVAMESGELSGSFEVVSVFRRPDQLHMSAFKGLLLSSRPIFELTFASGEYCLLLHHEDGGVEESRGEIESFVSRHRDMAELFWLRQLIFLPGEVNKVTGPIEKLPEGNSLILKGITVDGAQVTSQLDPQTLAVLSSSLTPPGSESTYEVHYAEYREIDGLFIPERIEVKSSKIDFWMNAVVGEMEVNGAVDPSVFEMDDKGSTPESTILEGEDEE
jgi:hypothetical protein